MQKLRWKVLTEEPVISQEVPDALEAIREAVTNREPLQVSSVDDVPWSDFAIKNADPLRLMAKKLERNSSLLGDQLLVTVAQLNGEQKDEKPAARLLEGVGIGTLSLSKQQRSSLGRAVIERQIRCAQSRGDRGPACFNATDFTGAQDFDEEIVTALLSQATPSLFAAIHPGNLYDAFENACNSKATWKVALLAAVYGPQLKKLGINEDKLDGLIEFAGKLAGKEHLGVSIRTLIDEETIAAGPASVPPPDHPASAKEEEQINFLEATKRFRANLASRLGLLWKGVEATSPFELAGEHELKFEQRKARKADLGTFAGKEQIASSLQATADKTRFGRAKPAPDPNMDLLF